MDGSCPGSPPLPAQLQTALGLVAGELFQMDRNSKQGSIDTNDKAGHQTAD